MKRLPQCQTYVEPFCGSAAVLFAKEPSPVEVLNDADDRIWAIFKTLRDDRARFEERIRQTLYSRREYYEAGKRLAGRLLRPNWRDDDDEVLKVAVDAWITIQQSFSGNTSSLQRKSWGFSRDGKPPKRFAKIPDRFEVFWARLRNVYLDCGSYEAVLDRWDGPDTCFYVDPPYLGRDDRVYLHGLGADEHEALLQRLSNVKGSVVLSGYDTPLYVRLEASGWDKIFIQNLQVRAGNQTREKRFEREYIWLNPSARERLQQLELDWS